MIIAVGNTYNKNIYLVCCNLQMYCVHICLLLFLPITSISIPLAIFYFLLINSPSLLISQSLSICYHFIWKFSRRWQRDICSLWVLNTQCLCPCSPFLLFYPLLYTICSPDADKIDVYCMLVLQTRMMVPWLSRSLSHDTELYMIGSSVGDSDIWSVLVLSVCLYCSFS